MVDHDLKMISTILTWFRPQYSFHALNLFMVQEMDQMFKLKGKVNCYFSFLLPLATDIAVTC